MHEMSLCEGIVQLLQQQAAEQETEAQHYSRIKVVRLEIGALAGVELDALRFCFDLVCKDTLAEGAALDIIERPGLAWCQQCEKSVEIEIRYQACGDCGTQPLQITDGEQLRVKELEVD